jgi:hypothetical protein
MGERGTCECSYSYSGARSIAGGDGSHLGSSRAADGKESGNDGKRWKDRTDCSSTSTEKYRNARGDQRTGIEVLVSAAPVKGGERNDSVKIGCQHLETIMPQAATHNQSSFAVRQRNLHAPCARR